MEKMLEAQRIQIIQQEDALKEKEKMKKRLKDESEFKRLEAQRREEEAAKILKEL